MRHKVTPRTRELVSELRGLTTLVSPYLDLASPAAHAEWDALRALWPSDDDLSQGNMAIAESDLEWMPAKVRRFGKILRGKLAIANRRSSQLVPIYRAEP